MEPARILVVDDEAAILRLLKEALTQWGYQVTGATSAAEALQALRGDMFDAVITDIRMPDMNGLELLKENQRYEESVEVVGMTGCPSVTPVRYHRSNQGTIYLDEVDELTPGLQVKLLRVLQEMQVRPVGSTKAYAVDVRVIAATNRDLERTIAEGQLRQDLYYRLNVVRVSLAPLRARREDVPALANHFIRR